MNNYRKRQHQIQWLVILFPLLFGVIFLTLLPAPAGNKATTSLPQATLVNPATAPTTTLTMPKFALLPAGPQNHPPLMIRWSNWQPEFGPALVYAREADLAGMLQMEGQVHKMLMVTSYDEALRLISQATELQAAGVNWLGFNTENGLTPAGEMNSLNNPDPAINIVARLATLATANGFTLLWGPIRNTTDNVSDAAIQTMMTAGLRGVALQEQKFIETEPAAQRASAVARTRERYLALANELGITNFTIHVQIMHERCPNLANCVEFVHLLENMPIDSIAIWSNGPIPAGFVQAIRGN